MYGVGQQLTGLRAGGEGVGRAEASDPEKYMKAAEVAVVNKQTNSSHEGTVWEGLRVCRLQLLLVHWHKVMKEILKAGTVGLICWFRK